MRSATLVLAVLLAACDTSAPEGPPAPPLDPPTPVDAGVPLVRGDNFVESWGTVGIRMPSPPIIFGSFGSLPYAQDWQGPALGVNETSLVMSGRQDGKARVSRGGYALKPCLQTEDGATGPFYLSDGVDYALGEWPVDLGAPTDGLEPVVYGSHMVWDVLCTDPSISDDPVLEDLRVETALFVSGEPEFERVRFIRFEIVNTGSEPIDDLRAGVYGDLDVGGYAYNANMVGGQGPMSYVYVRPGYDGQDGHPGAFAALRYLETPSDGGLATRRVVYRNAGPGGIDAGSGLDEWSLTGPSGVEGFQNALRGLTNDGRSIFDPTTGAPSTLMYSGDPLSGTGWLDGTLPGGENGWDVRLITAAAPARLEAGASTVLTLALVSAVEADLETSLAYAESTLSALAVRPELWQFPSDAP